MSIYTLTGYSANYLALVEDHKRICAAARYMAKKRRKRTIVMYQWPVGGKDCTKAKPKTRTVLCVRGAILNGVYMGDVYIKESL